ncbi:MAG: hypothetical protein U0U09_14580 [Cyclobacteriaceae bacterium]
MINLSDYPNSEGGVAGLRLALFNAMGDTLFKIDHWQTLAFHTLKEINDVADVEHTENSIKNASAKVLNHFDINDDKDYDMFLEGNTSIPELTNFLPTRTFVNFILFLEKLPSHVFRSLESNVKEHLEEITSLIEWYESHPSIQTFLNEQRRPDNHEDGILYDFYSRCLDEQRQILKYFLHGVKERALHKSFIVPLGLGSIFSLSDRYRDYPYRLPHHNGQEYFDCRLIDQAGHRLAEIPLRQGRELEKLYSSHKEEFYNQLFTIKSIPQIFQSIEFHLGFIPLQNDRKPIFSELKVLFNSEQWMAFYALALPQVEGLFTDMVDLVNPAKKQKSLPIKVELIRPFHDLSDAYFDYYQYHVPRMRNKFMHTGYDENFKIKSYDLLTDLEHLIRTFYELKNSSVRVKRLHKRRNPMDFLGYREFAHYFALVDDLSDKQKKAIASDIEQFEKEFLNESCDILIVCAEAIQETPLVIKKIIGILEFHLESVNLPSQLNTLNGKEFKQKMEDKALVEKFRMAFATHQQELEELEYLGTFLNGYKVHLPSLDSKTALFLEKEKSDNSKFFANIKAAKNLVGD